MWTLQEAKNKFSAVVDAAMAGTPQEVTRRGKPAVVVVDAGEYKDLLERAGKRPMSFKEHLLNFPKGGPDDLFDREPVKVREIEF
jgi:antitoxin Phd